MVVPKTFVQAQMAACYKSNAVVTQLDWTTWLHMKGPGASPWLVRRLLIMSRLGEWHELAEAGGLATLPACWHLLYKHVFHSNMVSKSSCVLTFKDTSVCKSRSVLEEVGKEHSVITWGHHLIKELQGKRVWHLYWFLLVCFLLLLSLRSILTMFNWPFCAFNAGCIRAFFKHFQCSHINFDKTMFTIIHWCMWCSFKMTFKNLSRAYTLSFQLHDFYLVMFAKFRLNLWFYYTNWT